MDNDPAQLPSDDHLPAFLRPKTFTLDDPGRRELRAILSRQYYDKESILSLLSLTSLHPGDFVLGGDANSIWLNILQTTRKADELRFVLSAVLQDRRAKTWHARLREMLTAAPVIAAHSPVPIEWQPSAGFERQTGPQSSLLGIAFLAEGLRRARSVVRVKARFGDEWAHGSGFLITKSRVLTAHHVLFDEAGRRPTAVEIWFGHEMGWNGEAQKVDLYSGALASIRGDAADDWAIVDLVEPLRHDYPLLPPAEPSHPVSPGDRVYIIQHPNGGYKQVGLHRNTVTRVAGGRIQYLADTEQGSSGSPVFNDRWELVALHHRWIEEPREGDKPAEYRNQGVHVDRVIQGLAALAEPAAK